MKYYVCIENQQVISILNYEPNLPAVVRKVEISRIDYDKISKGTHQFDCLSDSVVEVIKEESKTADPLKDKREKLYFLSSTDWKVLRHLREKALGLETSLSEEEYIALEEQRQLTAKSIS